MKTPCQETNQRTVCRPFDRRRLDRNPQHVAGKADDLFPAGSGLNSDVQRCNSINPRRPGYSNRSANHCKDLSFGPRSPPSP